MARRTDVLQGTLDMLVLKTLSVDGALHGYAITQRIQRVSAELLRVEEGSLYPALHRMEQEGWVKGRWGRTETNRQAKIYELTGAGRRRLGEEQERWERLTEGVGRVLAYA